MKHIKFVLTLLILGFIALVVYQNQGFFFQPHTLSVNFYFFQFNFPETQMAVYWVLCFAAGFIIVLFPNIVLRLRAAARLRLLQKENLEQKETIAMLEEKLGNRMSGMAEDCEENPAP